MGTDQAGKGRHNVWSRALRRLTSTNEELVSETLRERSEASGAQTIASTSLRTRVTLQGTIAVMTLNPRTGNRWLEVELRDGTGSVELIWMGRRMIPGVVPGRTLRVKGLLTIADGRRVIYNP
ncbi:MAG TPA: OB-fold nucleic acid binding domain-containing protein, partial [Propionibacteriaceae bacterium]|nr:OB-fold nucleic acid binding domain-containing protein [Propionibacteriaceae bacterium]